VKPEAEWLYRNKHEIIGWIPYPPVQYLLIKELPDTQILFTHGMQILKCDLGHVLVLAAELLWAGKTFDLRFSRRWLF
jgi:hypothetical protein